MQHIPQAVGLSGLNTYAVKKVVFLRFEWMCGGLVYSTHTAMYQLAVKPEKWPSRGETASIRPGQKWLFFLYCLVRVMESCAWGFWEPRSDSALRLQNVAGNGLVFRPLGFAPKLYGVITLCVTALFGVEQCCVLKAELFL